MFDPWVGKIPLEEGNGNPLQYSCQDNPVDRGALWVSPWGCRELDTTEATRMHHLISNALKGCAEQEAKKDSLRCEVQTQVRCPTVLSNCGAQYLPVVSEPQKAWLAVLQITHS